MNMTLFRDIYGRADENGIISMDLLAAQAARRWDYSVSHNHHFYYGPVTGMVSRNAGYLFLGRLLSNHTNEHPDGVLTQEVFKSFFAVYEDAKGNLEYRPGHEAIPKSWFRRSSDYGLISLNLDIVSWVTKHPELGRYVKSCVTLTLVKYLIADQSQTALVVILEVSTLSPGWIYVT